MIDTNRPTCAVRGVIAPGALCPQVIVGMQFCGAKPGTCEHQREPARQPADTGLSLDDDTPLSGGACNLGGDCEACQ